MRSVALSVIVAIAAVTLQGCGLLNTLNNIAGHASFGYSECQVRIDEVTSPKKKDALDGLPAACKECCSSADASTKKCLDKGTEIIEGVYNTTQFNYSVQCLELFANSTDFSKEHNESTSQAPAVAQQFVDDHQSTMQADVQDIFDELLDAIKTSKDEDWMTKKKQFPEDFSNGLTNFFLDSSVESYRAQMLPNSRWTRPLILQGAVAVVLFAAALVAWRRRAQAPRWAPPAELLVAE